MGTSPDAVHFSSAHLSFYNFPFLSLYRPDARSKGELRSFRDSIGLAVLPCFIDHVNVVLLLLQLISNNKLNGFFLFLKPIYSIKERSVFFSFASCVFPFFHPPSREHQGNFAMVFYILQLLHCGDLFHSHRGWPYRKIHV